MIIKKYIGKYFFEIIIPKWKRLLIPIFWGWKPRIIYEDGFIFIWFLWFFIARKLNKEG